MQDTHGASNQSESTPLLSLTVQQVITNINSIVTTYLQNNSDEVRNNAHSIKRYSFCYCCMPQDLKLLAAVSDFDEQINPRNGGYTGTCKDLAELYVNTFQGLSGEDIIENIGRELTRGFGQETLQQLWEQGFPSDDEGNGMMVYVLHKDFATEYDFFASLSERNLLSRILAPASHM